MQLLLVGLASHSRIVPVRPCLERSLKRSMPHVRLQVNSGTNADAASSSWHQVLLLAVVGFAGAKYMRDRGHAVLP